LKLIGGFLVTVAVLAGGFTAGNNFAIYTYEAGLGKSENLRTMADLFSQIESDYVEEVDLGLLEYAAINGALESLDPHSVFFDPDEYAELQRDTQGNYYGVGVEVRQASPFGLEVSGIIPNGPAESSDLMVGDRVIAVDNQSLEEISYTDSIFLIRGPIGEPVSLTVERVNGEDTNQLTTHNIDLVRDKVHTPSVTLELSNDSIAYIHFRKFRLDSSTELSELIEELPSSTKAIVIDLRSNPGGLLSEAVKSVDLFVDEGTIVTTRGRAGVLLETFAATSGTVTELPLVVLIDEFSASAAEIFAGALQDFGRGEIVGNTSYGKGSVQAIYELPDESAMKLTIARYHLPNGRAIEAMGGVDPDIVVEIPKESAHTRVRFRSALEERLPEDPQLTTAFSTALELIEQ